jgi:hypothetical protein
MRSASWPLVAEQSTKGATKSAPMTRPASSGGSQGTCSLVGDEDGEGELEDVVVARAEELHPEEGREAALAQERELVGGVRAHARGAAARAGRGGGDGPILALGAALASPPEGGTFPAVERGRSARRQGSPRPARL